LQLILLLVLFPLNTKRKFVLPLQSRGNVVAAVAVVAVVAVVGVVRAEKRFMFIIDYFCLMMLILLHFSHLLHAACSQSQS